jgi:hypothetical protein
MIRDAQRRSRHFGGKSTTDWTRQENMLRQNENSLEFYAQKPKRRVAGTTPTHAQTLHGAEVLFTLRRRQVHELVRADRSQSSRRPNRDKRRAREWNSLSSNRELN